MCRFLRDVLQRDPALKVVGYALDAYEARSMIKTLRPDVLTLDVEMPRMDGLTFLRNLMRLRPMPVVMLSSLTAAGAEVTLEALSIGAVDFMVKRHPGSGSDYQRYVSEITDKVRHAAHTQVGAVPVRRSYTARKDIEPWKHKLDGQRPLNDRIDRVIGLGASTGGPEALKMVLESMYLPRCALLISQHMPAKFMAAFASRLNGYSRFEVCEATDGTVLQPGYCYVAPGDRHLKLSGSRSQPMLKLSTEAQVMGHRPSVNVMYESLARRTGSSAIGVLLTGMGKDGGSGMRQLKDSGAFTLIQDKNSSAVWGMPGAAAEQNAVDATLALQEIGPTLEALLVHE